MDREIIGFHQDKESHWVAELSCGHHRHVRHIPPLADRQWTQSTATRGQKLGLEVECTLCGRLELPAQFVCYKKTDIFTSKTIPEGFLREHRIRRGIWAKIEVLEGRLRFVLGAPYSQQLELTAPQSANIPPEQLHRLEAQSDDIRLRMSFFRDPDQTASGELEPFVRGGAAEP